jgi:hypothetical protein
MRPLETRHNQADREAGLVLDANRLVDQPFLGGLAGQLLISVS